MPSSVNLVVAAIVMLIVVTLPGCTNTRVVRTTETVVIKAPDSMFECPDSVEWPNGQYTQRPVAGVAERLYEDREICRSSLKAIKKYNDEAEARLKKPEQAPAKKREWWRLW